MNNLIPWLPGYLTPGGNKTVGPRVLYGEVQPPVHETAGKPAARVGPTIEGEAVSHGALDGAKALIRKRLQSLIGNSALGTLAGGADAALGPMGAVIAAGDGRPDNSAADLAGLTNAYAAARANNPHTAYPAGQVTSAPLPPAGQPSPNDQVAARFGGMQAPAPASFNERFGSLAPAVLARGDRLGPTPADQIAARTGAFQPPAGNLPPWAQVGPITPGNFPQAPAQAQARAPAQMPQARPAEAPAPTPAMNFFQRNAAMMRDPVTGMFIDPEAAARAQRSFKT